LAGEESLVCESFVAIVASGVPSANARVGANDLDPADQWIRSIVFFDTINIDTASFVRAHTCDVVPYPVIQCRCTNDSDTVAVKVSKTEIGTMVSLDCEQIISHTWVVLEDYGWIASKPDPGFEGEVTALEIEFSFGPLVRNIHGPGSVKGKRLAYLAGREGHSALQRAAIGDVMDVIGIAFSWPPGSHVWRWWRARLALARATRVVDVPNFSHSESAVEDFHFVDLTVELLPRSSKFVEPSNTDKGAVGVGERG
jgi:hypothetical protein